MPDSYAQGRILSFQPYSVAKSSSGGDEAGLLVFEQVAGARGLDDIGALAGLHGGAQDVVEVLLPDDFQLDVRVFGVEDVDELLLELVLQRGLDGLAPPEDLGLFAAGGIAGGGGLGGGLGGGGIATALGGGCGRGCGGGAADQHGGDGQERQRQLNHTLHTCSLLLVLFKSIWCEPSKTAGVSITAIVFLLSQAPA